MSYAVLLEGLKFYKVMAIPTLLHGAETWVPKTKYIVDFKLMKCD